MSDGQFMSVRDAATGELIWKQGYDIEVVGGVGEDFLGGDPVVVGEGSQAVVITRFTSLVDQAGNRVGDLSYSGLMALSLADGHLVWRTDVVQIHADEKLDTRLGLVAANAEVALVEVFGREPGNPDNIDFRLVAVDTHDGNLRWSVPGVRGEYLSLGAVGVTLTGLEAPTLDSMMTGNGVAVLNADTGAELWRLDAEKTRAEVGNAKVLAAISGEGIADREIKFLSATDGQPIEVEQSVTGCEASDSAVACSGAGRLLVLDALAAAHTANLPGTFDNVDSVQGDLIVVRNTVTDDPPSLWTRDARPVETNLPGRILGRGEGYVAVGIGDQWTGEVLVYRQATAEPGLTPSLTPKEPTGFPTPSDPSDYLPPRPDPLVAPITLGEELWQTPAKRQAYASFYRDALIVLSQYESDTEPARVQVFDSTTGAVRWTRDSDAPLPDGDGDYLTFDPFYDPQPLVTVDAGQPVVVVPFSTNSCSTGPGDCRSGFTTSRGVVALSLADGSIVWKYVAAQADTADDTVWRRRLLPAGAADGVLIFTRADDEPNPRTDLVIALDATTGTELWTRPGLFARAVNNQLVFASVASGTEYDERTIDSTEALDLHTGEVIWRESTKGSWPIAATDKHVAVREFTHGSAGNIEIRDAASGAIVQDLGSSHWDCNVIGDELACGSTFGIKMVPDDGEQWLLNTPDEYRISGLDGWEGGPLYFVSTPGQDNAGADTSLMVDRNGTPVGELPGRVLAMSSRYAMVLLADTASLKLYRYQR